MRFPPSPLPPDPLLYGLLSLALCVAGCQLEDDATAPGTAGDRSLPASNAIADVDPDEDEAAPRILTRLFWQDHASATVGWVDVHAGDVHAGDEPSFGEPQTVADFPELDAAQRKLVQMKVVDGLLLVGVRDDADGAEQSGWVAVDTGVREEAHGDHSHWRYEAPPRVIASRLDAEQGNPAHLYVYDGEFYLANDRRDGYTRLAPDAIRSAGADAGRFYPGGGNHITLAAAGGRVGYASWIDGGGPHAGRVDVTPLDGAADGAGDAEIAYQLTLPTGVIHGAAVAGGKAFFAPADGICWVTVDPEADDDPALVVVHHVDLGEDAAPDTPRRTGAFTTDRDGRRDWLLFTTGKGERAALGLMDASAETPEPILVDLGADPDRLTTPPTPFRVGRKRLAAVFLDYAEPEGDEELVVVDLDPNGDRDRSDAAVLKRIAVGNSAVDGHSGHHDLATEPGRDCLFVVNPGDGTLVAVDLESWERGPSLSVPGQPNALLSVGGRVD